LPPALQQRVPVDLGVLVKELLCLACREGPQLLSVKELEERPVPAHYADRYATGRGHEHDVLRHAEHVPQCRLILFMALVEQQVETIQENQHPDTAVG